MSRAARSACLPPCPFAAWLPPCLGQHALQAALHSPHPPPLAHPEAPTTHTSRPPFNTLNPLTPHPPHRRCNPFDLTISNANLQRGFNKVYDLNLANSLKRIFAGHEPMWRGAAAPLRPDLVPRARTIRDFDEAITVHSFGACFGGARGGWGGRGGRGRGGAQCGRGMQRGAAPPRHAACAP